MLRFTFPREENASIQIDLARRIGGTSTKQYVRVIDAQTTEGWMLCPAEGGGSGNGQGHVMYTVYFRMQFSKPFHAHGAWTVELPPTLLQHGEELIADRMQSDAYYEAALRAKVKRDFTALSADHIGFFAECNVADQQAILVKAGISFVDMEGARKNLGSDLPDWNFAQVRQRARQQWSPQLDRIAIEGAT